MTVDKKSWGNRKNIQIEDVLEMEVMNNAFNNEKSKREILLPSILKKG
jgi:hypothetical protein